MFLYREEYYLGQPEGTAGTDSKTIDELKHSSRGEAEVIVRKNRQGTIGDAKLYFDAERQRFSNWTNRPLY